ncbi:MAG: hypothetical protein M3280_03330 [Actinomycetota bacterium]|nr:hypothetical protein [Actinomycetota bacterium]
MIAGRISACVAACVFLAAACSDVSFVDEVTIVNDTEYPADVEVTGRARDRWLGLTVVTQRSTATVDGVIDQGEMWIFRFHYTGRYEELEISRNELERNDWTIEVPQSFEQRLRDLGVPPPP